MQRIDTEQLEQIRQRENDLIVVDVLDPEHFRNGHIPGSDNIPLSDARFVDQVAQRVSGREQPVVVYCGSDSCDASARAATILETAGFDRVYEYEGGLEAWEEAGKPVQAGLPPGTCASEPPAEGEDDEAPSARFGPRIRKEQE